MAASESGHIQAGQRLHRFEVGTGYETVSCRLLERAAGLMGNPYAAHPTGTRCPQVRIDDLRVALAAAADKQNAICPEQVGRNLRLSEVPLEMAAKCVHAAWHLRNGGLLRIIVIRSVRGHDG